MEIQRLQREMEKFDLEIAECTERVALYRSPVDRIYLSAIRAARFATQQALEVWLDRYASEAALQHETSCAPVATFA